jgi:hypothetical protein
VGNEAWQSDVTEGNVTEGEVSDEGWIVVEKKRKKHGRSQV